MMGQDLNRIEKLYDTVASAYTEVFSGEHDKKPMDQEMLHRFSVGLGGRRPVWDLGCGPGHTSNYLKNLGVEISGLDLSEKMIEQARANHPEIHFQKGNILDLEFDDDSIGGILSFYTIVHFTNEQVERAFREAFRVLFPGGLLLLTYHIDEKIVHLDEFLGKKIDIDFMFFTSDFITNCLRDNGFEKLEMIERDPYPGLEYESRRAYVFARKPASV